MAEKAPYQPPPIDYGASLAKREVPGPWTITYTTMMPTRENKLVCNTPEEVHAAWVKYHVKREDPFAELHDANGQRWSYRLGWGWWHPAISIDWSKARG